jgi:enamine deaminase RidA (YjgF/YER057c/UK114 family)
LVGESDALAQSAQCLENVEQALRAAGATRADVTKITAFLVNSEDYPAYAKARLEFFGNPGPASSTVFISGLVNPKFLVEIEAIAVV